MKVKIKQELGLPTEARIDKTAQLVVLLPEIPRRGAWPPLPYGEQLKPRYEKRRQGSAPLVTDLPNRPGTHTVVAQLAPDISPFALLGLARRLAALPLEQDPKEIVILCAGLNPQLAERAARAMVAALLAAAHAMPSFKATNNEARRGAAPRCSSP